MPVEELIAVTGQNAARVFHLQSLLTSHLRGP
jgi:hypothetical protein